MKICIRHKGLLGTVIVALLRRVRLGAYNFMIGSKACSAVIHPTLYDPVNPPSRRRFTFCQRCRTNGNHIYLLLVGVYASVMVICSESCWHAILAQCTVPFRHRRRYIFFVFQEIIEEH